MTNFPGEENPQAPVQLEAHRVWAPFAPPLVEALRVFQQEGYWHPFTCPYRDRPDHEADDVLVPSTEGWHCPDQECGYTQLWAHDFMADPEWVHAEIDRMRSMFGSPPATS